MSWFLMALLSTLCFSTITHIDKYLLSRYLKTDGVGGLMLFSSLFAVLALPVIYIIDRGVFSVPILNTFILIVVGILSFLAIFFYFKALTYTDASIISPFFQLIPVFGFILGFFLLEELIPVKSIIAGLIIIAGVLVISFNKESGKPMVFQKKVVFLMVGSSFVYAFYEVLFKIIAVQENFWPSLFWQNAGLLIAGLFLYIFIPRYRRDFHGLIKDNGINIFSLNLVNEALNTIAVALLQYASLLVPIVLVMLVNSLQPAVVFLMGVVLTIFLPKLSKEKIAKPILIQKSLAILIIFIGTYILYH